MKVPQNGRWQPIRSFQTKVTECRLSLLNIQLIMWNKTVWKSIVVWKIVLDTNTLRKI